MVGEWARERPHAADLSVGSQGLHDRPAVPRLSRDEREAHRFRVTLQLGSLGARAGGHDQPPTTRRQCTSSAAVRASRDGGANRPRRRSTATRSSATSCGWARRSPPTTRHKYTTDTTLCGLPSTPASRGETRRPIRRRWLRARPLPRSRVRRSVRASRWRRPSRRRDPTGRHRRVARAGSGRARRRSRRRHRPSPSRSRARERSGNGPRPRRGPIGRRTRGTSARAVVRNGRDRTGRWRSAVPFARGRALDREVR